MSKIIQKLEIEKTLKLAATFSVAFLLAFVAFGMLTPIEKSSALDCESSTSSNPSEICDTTTTDVNVSIEGSWTISVSSSGALGLNLTPNSSGTLSTVVDNLNIYTNTPNGYQLYLNSTSGSTDIYNNNILDENGNIISDPSSNPDGSGIINTNHFSATTGTKASPVVLTNNTWGYSLASSPTTFSKVELTNTSADSLISTGSKTTGAGDNIDVTYGFMADTKLTPGTYTTSVTYTAVAEVPSYNITSISPNELHINDQTDKQITIMTSTPSSELGLGNITAKIGTIDLTNCSETIVNGYRGATCIYTGSLPVGAYNVQLTSSWHSATYTLNNAFTIYKTVQDITTMQEMTSDICNRMSDNQTATLQDPRGSYNTTTPANYGIVKALDGNCWMRDNLNLYNRKITSDNSDLENGITYTIPDTSNWHGDVYDYSPRVHRGSGAEYVSNVYYNFTTAVALIDGSVVGQQYYSICPMNWQLPINVNDEDVDKSYAKLMKSYGVTKPSQLTTVSSGAYILNIKALGRWSYDQNQEDGMNIRGYYRTSTSLLDRATNAYEFYIRTTDDYMKVNGADPKAQGYIIRCVAR